MIRKNTNGDISDEEFKAILKPFIDDYDDFVISYIMPEVLVNCLKKAKLEAKQLNGFNENYFVAGDAFPISSNALADRKNTNCEKAGVKQIRLHDFRHSCASLLINKGANIQVVAKYLGHTKIEETLKTYSHLFISTLDEIINVIDTLEDNKTDD